MAEILTRSNILNSYQNVEKSCSLMKSRKKKGSGTRRRNDFSEFIDQLIQKYENTPGAQIQINSLSLENTIEKRRLYDLLNVFVACDICTKTDSHNYVWNSVNNTKNTVRRISYEIESRAIHETWDEIFVLPDSPSIGLITSRFIGVFLYLNLPSMNIRNAALFMSADDAHFKPILRRLYLVAFLLERIGLFSHVQKIGEYRLDVDMRSISIQSLESLAKAEEFPPDSIEYQLNRFDDNYLDMSYSARMALFVEILRKRKTDQSNDSSNSTPRIALPSYQSIYI